MKKEIIIDICDIQIHLSQKLIVKIIFLQIQRINAISAAEFLNWLRDSRNNNFLFARVAKMNYLR